MMANNGELAKMDRKAAVSIVDALKTYSAETVVLNGLNMRVPSGSIYGLLGSSGCGKTTLLNAILGKLTLDSGTIEVDASSVLEIGYMPQDVCLDNLLTIRETLQYYGCLYLMSGEDIAKNSKRLSRWLKLPPMDSLLKNASGGQMRRVSLAVSLIHDPKILILDEPTVGIDPILRHEIWQELLKIVNEQGKTIIITTHYIEEARQSHMIGLMRNGVLIKESSPNQLLVEQNTNTLEDAFLALSSHQDLGESRVQYKQTLAKQSRFNNTKSLTSIQTPSKISLIRIKALLKKNIVVCSRDYMFVFLVIFFPILAALIYNLAIGRNVEDVKIHFQNNEIHNCKNTSVVGGCLYDDDYVNSHKLSCQLIDRLRSLKYDLVPIDSQKAGDLAVDKTKAFAFIQFPKNHTYGLRQYVQGAWKSDVEIPPDTIARVHVDSGSVLIKNQIIYDLNNVYGDIILASSESCKGKSVRGNPLRIKNVVGGKVKAYIHSIATMFVAMIGFYFSSIISAGFMLKEKMEGYLDRALTAGVKIPEVIISITLIQTVIHVFHMVCVMTITYIMFRNPIEITSGLVVYAFLSIFTGWLGLLTGFLVVGVSKSGSEAMHLVIGWNMMQVYVSGVTWPIEAQPTVMKAISEHLPLCYISRLMNDIALKGWTIDCPAIWKGTAMVIVYILLHSIMLCCLSRVKKEAWLIRK
ncbi:ABC transporter G family member 20-like isoform X2 [Adelges cooleyi]|nr:ABC transporter G family member 20-like isoform X2 [Adelges cooleyi]